MPLWNYGSNVPPAPPSVGQKALANRMPAHTLHISKSTPMECFSAEAPDSQRVEHGRGSWWNALLVHNMDPAQKDKKPFSCALRCGHTWGAKTANAFKVAGHIAGDINDVKFCKKATPADIALAKSKRLKQPAKAQAEAPPDAKRAKVEAMAGTAVPGSPPGTGPRQSATAEVEHAAAEEVREAGLTGMFRHMNDKAACARLLPADIVGTGTLGRPDRNGTDRIGSEQIGSDRKRGLGPGGSPKSPPNVLLAPQSW